MASSKSGSLSVSASGAAPNYKQFAQDILKIYHSQKNGSTGDIGGKGGGSATVSASSNGNGQIALDIRLSESSSNSVQATTTALADAVRSLGGVLQDLAAATHERVMDNKTFASWADQMQQLMNGDARMLTASGKAEAHSAAENLLAALTYYGDDGMGHFGEVVSRRLASAIGDQEPDAKWTRAANSMQTAAQAVDHIYAQQLSTIEAQYKFDGNKEAYERSLTEALASYASGVNGVSKQVDKLMHNGIQTKMPGADSEQSSAEKSRREDVKTKQEIKAAKETEKTQRAERKEREDTPIPEEPKPAASAKNGKATRSSQMTDEEVIASMSESDRRQYNRTIEQSKNSELGRKLAQYAIDQQRKRIDQQDVLDAISQQPQQPKETNIETNGDINIDSKKAPDATNNARAGGNGAGGVPGGGGANNPPNQPAPTTPPNPPAAPNPPTPPAPPVAPTPPVSTDQKDRPMYLNKLSELTDLLDSEGLTKISQEVKRQLAVLKSDKNDQYGSSASNITATFGSDGSFQGFTLKAKSITLGDVDTATMSYQVGDDMVTTTRANQDKLAKFTEKLAQDTVAAEQQFNMWRTHSALQSKDTSGRNNRMDQLLGYLTGSNGQQLGFVDKSGQIQIGHYDASGKKLSNLTRTELDELQGNLGVFKNEMSLLNRSMRQDFAQNGIDVIGQKHDKLLAERDLLSTRLSSMGLKQNGQLRDGTSLASLFGRINAAEGRYKGAAGNVDAQVKAYNDLHDAIKQADAAVQGEMRTRSASMALTREDIRTQNILSKAQEAMSAKNADAQTGIMKTLQKSINQLQSAGTPEEKLRALNSITQQTSRLTKATSEYNAQAKHMSKLDSQLGQMRTKLKEAGDLKEPESMRLAAKAMGDFKQSKTPQARSEHAKEVEDYIQQARADVSRAVKVENAASTKFDRDAKKAENQYNRITKNDLLAAADRAEIEKAYKAFSKGRSDTTLDGLQKALDKATGNIAKTDKGNKTAEVQARIDAKQLALATAKERAGGQDNWSEENRALFKKAEDELAEASAQLKNGSVKNARSFLGRATTDLSSLNAELGKSETAIKKAAEAQEQKRKEDETITKATGTLNDPRLAASSAEATTLKAALDNVAKVRQTGTGDMTKAMADLTGAMAPADAALKKFEQDAKQAEQAYNKLTASDGFRGLSGDEQAKVTDALATFQSGFGGRTASNLQALKDAMEYAGGLIDAQSLGDKRDNYTQKLTQSRERLTRSEQRNGGAAKWTDAQLDMYNQAENFLKAADEAVQKGNFDHAQKSLANFGVAMSRMNDSFTESEKVTAAAEAQQKQTIKEQEKAQKAQEKAAAAEERQIRVDAAKAETAQTRAERSAYYGAVDQSVQDRVTEAKAVFKATGTKEDLEEYQKALQSLQRHEMNAEMGSYAERLNRMMNPTGELGVDLSKGWAAAQVAMRDELIKMQEQYAGAIVDPMKQAEAGGILKQMSSKTSQLEQSLADTQKLQDAAKALESTGNYSRVTQGLKDNLTTAMDEMMNTSSPDKFIEKMNAVRGAISAISNEMKQIGLDDYWGQQTAALQNYNNTLQGLASRNGGQNKWTDSQRNAYDQAQQAFAEAEQARQARDMATYQDASKRGNERMNALNQSLTEVGKLSAGSKPQVDALSRSLMNFAAPMMLFRKFTGYMKKAAQNVSAIDSQMADLKKVTSNTDAEYQIFLQKAGQHAVQIGSSITDLVATTSTFAHMGYNLNDSQALGVTATKFANVGGFKNTTDAADTIIAAVKGFKDLNIGDADEVGDKLTAVANNYAVTATDISEGLRHSASALNVAGNDIDQSTAMITAIAEVTRDAGGAGSALKVLSMRIRGAKAELTDAGESTEGMAESVSKLRSEVYGLTNVGGKGGVDIMADEDTFKSTYDILHEISKVWGDMSDINRSALLEKLAGKVRSNQVAALLENFDQAERVLETSRNAKGTMSQVHARWMDSVEARQAQFKAAQETASMAAMPASTLKGLYQAGTTGLGLLTNMMNIFGSGGVGIGAIGTAAALKSGAGNIWAGLGQALNWHIGGRGQKGLIDAYNLAYSDATADTYHNKDKALGAAINKTETTKVNNYTRSLINQADGTVDATKATSSLAMSLKGLAKNALGAVATFGLIEIASFAAQKAWDAIDYEINKGQYLAEAADTAYAQFEAAQKTAKDSAEETKTLQVQIDELRGKENKTPEETQRLASMESQLRTAQLTQKILDLQAKQSAKTAMESWSKSFSENETRLYENNDLFSALGSDIFVAASNKAKKLWESMYNNPEVDKEQLDAVNRNYQFMLRAAQSSRAYGSLEEYLQQANEAGLDPAGVAAQYGFDVLKVTPAQWFEVKAQTYADEYESEHGAADYASVIGQAKAYNELGQMLTSNELAPEALIAGYAIIKAQKDAVTTAVEGSQGAIDALGVNAVNDLLATETSVSNVLANRQEDYRDAAEMAIKTFVGRGFSASDEELDNMQKAFQGYMTLSSAVDENISTFDALTDFLSGTTMGDALAKIVELGAAGELTAESLEGLKLDDVQNAGQLFSGLLGKLGIDVGGFIATVNTKAQKAKSGDDGNGGVKVPAEKLSQARVDAITSAQSLGAKLWKSAGFTGSLDPSSKEYQELMSMDDVAYRAAIDYANGTLFFDKDAFDQIVQQKYKEQLADLRADAAEAEKKFAAAAQTYAEQLGKKTANAKDFDETAYTNAIKDIQTYGDNLTSYRSMMAQIDYGMSGLSNWINNKNGAEAGDIYDELGNAAKAIRSGQQSGLVGTREFRAALQFYGGEDLKYEDLTAKDWGLIAGFAGVGKDGSSSKTVRKDTLAAFQKELMKVGVLDEKGVWTPGMTTDEAATLYNAQYKTHINGEVIQAALLAVNDYLSDETQHYTFTNEAPVANQKVLDAQDEFRAAVKAYNENTGSLEDVQKAAQAYLAAVTEDQLNSENTLVAANAALSTTPQQSGDEGGGEDPLTGVLSKLVTALTNLNKTLGGEEPPPPENPPENPPEGTGEGGTENPPETPATAGAPQAPQPQVTAEITQEETAAIDEEVERIAEEANRVAYTGNISPETKEALLTAAGNLVSAGGEMAQDQVTEMGAGVEDLTEQAKQESDANTQRDTKEQIDELLGTAGLPQETAQKLEQAKAEIEAGTGDVESVSQLLVRGYQEINQAEAQRFLDMLDELGNPQGTEQTRAELESIVKGEGNLDDQGNQLAVAEEVINESAQEVQEQKEGVAQLADQGTELLEQLTDLGASMPPSQPAGREKTMWDWPGLTAWNDFRETLLSGNVGLPLPGDVINPEALAAYEQALEEIKAGKVPSGWSIQQLFTAIETFRQQAQTLRVDNQKKQAEEMVEQIDDVLKGYDDEDLNSTRNMLQTMIDNGDFGGDDNTEEILAGAQEQIARSKEQKQTQLKGALDNAVDQAREARDNASAYLDDVNVKELNDAVIRELEQIALTDQIDSTTLSELTARLNTAIKTAESNARTKENISRQEKEAAALLEQMRQLPEEYQDEALLNAMSLLQESEFSGNENDEEVLASAQAILTQRQAEQKQAQQQLEQVKTEAQKVTDELADQINQTNEGTPLGQAYGRLMAALESEEDTSADQIGDLTAQLSAQAEADTALKDLNNLLEHGNLSDETRAQLEKTRDNLTKAMGGTDASAISDLAAETADAVETAMPESDVNEANDLLEQISKFPESYQKDSELFGRVMSELQAIADGEGGTDTGSTFEATRVALARAEQQRDAEEQEYQEAVEQSRRYEELREKQRQEVIQKQADKDRETLRSSNIKQAQLLADVGEQPEDLREAAQATAELQEAIQSHDQERIAAAAQRFKDAIYAAFSGMGERQQKEAEQAAQLDQERLDKLYGIDSEENAAIRDAASNADRNDIDMFSNYAKIDYESGDWEGFEYNLQQLQAALERASKNTKLQNELDETNAEAARVIAEQKNQAKANQDARKDLEAERAAAEAEEQELIDQQGAKPKPQGKEQEQVDQSWLTWTGGGMGEDFISHLAKELSTPEVTATEKPEGETEQPNHTDGRPKNITGQAKDTHTTGVFSIESDTFDDSSWSVNGLNFGTHGVNANGQAFTTEQIEAYVDGIVKAGISTVEELMEYDNPENGGWGIIGGASVWDMTPYLDTDYPVQPEIAITPETSPEEPREDIWDINGLEVTTNSLDINGAEHTFDELNDYMSRIEAAGINTPEDLYTYDNPANGGLGVITGASYAQPMTDTGAGVPTPTAAQNQSLDDLYDQAELLTTAITAYLEQSGLDGNEQLWNKGLELQNAYAQGDDANIGRLVKEAQELYRLVDQNADAAQEQAEASQEITEKGFLVLAGAGASDVGPGLPRPGQQMPEEAAQQGVDVGVSYDVPEIDIPQPDDVQVGVEADTTKAQNAVDNIQGGTVTVEVQYEAGKMPSPEDSSSNKTATTGDVQQAATGTEHAAKAMYLVDERGQELIEHVSQGTYELGTNDGPRFTRLDAGDIVHTAKETRKILRRGGAMANGGKVKVAQPYVSGGNGGVMGGNNTGIPSAAQAIGGYAGQKQYGQDPGPQPQYLATGTQILKFLQNTFDWIPTFLNVLKKKTTEFINAADDAIHYIGKNKMIDSAIGNVAAEIQANMLAALRYREFLVGMAYKGALPIEIIHQIQNGTLDIQKYQESTIEKNGGQDGGLFKAIQAYQEYWNKLVACQDALKALNDQMEALAKQKMDNIVRYFEQIDDLLSKQQKSYESLLDLKKQYGQEINAEDYTASLKTLEDMLDNTQNEETAVVAELSDQLGIGEDIVRALLDGGKELWDTIGAHVQKATDLGIEDLANGQVVQNASIQQGIDNGEIPNYWATFYGQRDMIDSNYGYHGKSVFDALDDEGKNVVEAALDRLDEEAKKVDSIFNAPEGVTGISLPNRYELPTIVHNPDGSIAKLSRTGTIATPDELFPLTMPVEPEVEPPSEEDIRRVGEMLGLDMVGASEEVLANYEMVKSLFTTSWENPLAIGSETWYSYMATLEELRGNIYATKVEISEMNDEIAKIPLINLQTGFDYLEDIMKNLEGINDLLDAQGSTKSSGTYQTMISVGMKQIENLEEQNKLIEEQMSLLDPLSEKYQELRDDLNNNLDSIADIRENQERWNDAIIDLQIDRLRKQNDKYKEQLSLMRALDDLENARQRRILTYHDETGFVYEADEDALEAAQESAYDAVYSSMISQLEDQKELSNIYGPLGERLIQDSSIVDSLGNILVPVEDKLSGLDFGAYYQSILDGAEQTGLLTSLLNSIDMTKLLESAIKENNISIDLSGMTLNEVNDVKDLCDAIMQQLPNYLLQAMYQKGA